MQALVGSLVDVAGSLIGGVTLAEGDHVPGEALVGLLDQLENESVASLCGALLAERPASAFRSAFAGRLV
ncbi:MAG TPA: hypothetical protein VES65_01330 [Solirubrobacteraceae bacterium]|nr:hypothetical protein [Solirubrobacteraceae bacterium]